MALLLTLALAWLLLAGVAGLVIGRAIRLADEARDAESALDLPDFLPPELLESGPR